MPSLPRWADAPLISRRRLDFRVRADGVGRKGSQHLTPSSRGTPPPAPRCRGADTHSPTVRCVSWLQHGTAHCHAHLCLPSRSSFICTGRKSSSCSGAIPPCPALPTRSGVVGAVATAPPPVLPAKDAVLLGEGSAWLGTPLLSLLCPADFRESCAVTALRSSLFLPRPVSVSPTTGLDVPALMGSG